MWGAHEERHPHISAEIKKKFYGRGKASVGTWELKQELMDKEMSIPGRVGVV